MQENLELVNAIQLGLRKGFYQNLQFRNKWTSFEDKMTEYLLTVFVALEVKELFGNASQFDVQLEYRLLEFYNNAFPRIKWSDEKDLFAETLFREFQADPSKKRIDIAIMYTQNRVFENYRSFYGIEIKAINQHLSTIENDVFRLSQSMTTTDRIDPNSINKCFSAFIKLYKNKDKEATELNLEEMRSKAKNEIESLLNNKFRPVEDYQQLEYITHSEKIDSMSIESYYNSIKHIPDFDLSWDPQSETGEIMGFVIEIRRR